MVSSEGTGKLQLGVCRMPAKAPTLAAAVQVAAE